MADQTQQPAAPVAADPAPVRRTTARRFSRGYVAGASLVLFLCLSCMGAFAALLSTSRTDPGVRVWLLNHAPDQIAIVNPYDGVTEKKLSVADGLRGLNFSTDGSKAYVQNVVDVTNKLTVINTQNYLKDDVIEVDGVPQGVGVFPDTRKLAVILGSRTEFMAGGFDVLDLKAQTEADPSKKKVLMHERDLRLAHKIAVGDDGDRIYMIDAKSAELAVYSFATKQRLKAVNLGGACEDFIYPRPGKYYYASVLEHFTIYQISKDTDEIVGGYIYSDMLPDKLFWKPWLRKMAVDPTGNYLYGTATERKAVAIWEVNNPDYRIDLRTFHGDPNSDGSGFKMKDQIPLYLPMSRFTLNGGYLPPGTTDIPGPSLVATDPLNSYIFVVDEKGALYIYDRDKVQIKQPPTYYPTHQEQPAPHKIASDLASDTTEVRDIAVSQPVVRLGGVAAPVPSDAAPGGSP